MVVEFHILSKSKSLLSTTFSIDIRKDDPDIHPPSYCHKCMNVMQQILQKGPSYKHTVTPFDCSERLHITDLEKGGGRNKDKKEKEKMAGLTRAATE